MMSQIAQWRLRPSDGVARQQYYEAFCHKCQLRNQMQQNPTQCVYEAT